jgi:hypothetical protein
MEIGLDDHGPRGTKELNEKRLKTPKMMRCFCSRIVEQFKTSPNKIKIVGIIISGEIKKEILCNQTALIVGYIL